MRAMGLDVGERTVGVAISDSLGATAQAITTVRRTKLAVDLAELTRLATEYEVDRLVVGLPLNMNGTEGPRAEASRRLGEALADVSGLPVTFWDERLSTVAVQRVLLEADVSRKKRKEVVDKLAAAYILQGWLDSQPGHQQEYDD